MRSLLILVLALGVASAFKVRNPFERDPDNHNEPRALRDLGCYLRDRNKRDQSFLATHPVTNFANKKWTIPTFDEAFYYMNFPAATYVKERSKIASWSCVYCKNLSPSVELISIFENKPAGTLALVNIDKAAKQVIVTFRGSSNVQNAIQDIDVVKTIFKEGPAGVEVHRGFYIAVNTLMPEIFEQLRKLYDTYPDFELVFTGHSLGSAMATLGLFMTITDPSFSHLKYSLYAYGTPRVGTLEFSTWANQFPIRGLRVVNKKDLVAHVPTVDIGFYHVGTELWLSTDKDHQFCSTTLFEDPDCSNSMQECFNGWDHEHYFHTYIGGKGEQGLNVGY